MREAIALIDVMIVEAFDGLRVGKGDWSKAADALDRLRTAGDNLNAARNALDDLDAAVGTGRTRERAWADLRGLFLERDRLLSGEAARHKATADFIHADRVAAFMVGMIDALREESQDKELLRRVFKRWERLMGLAGVTTPPKSAIPHVR